MNIPKFFLLAVSLFAMARVQSQDFPIYQDLALAKPSGLPTFSAADFKVDKDRLDQYPGGFVGSDRQVLGKLSDYLLNDPDGRKVWAERASMSAKVLNQWDFDRKGFERYVYQVHQLQELSLVYLFTGHKALGQFIRGHVLQISRLPFEFWLHAELRGYNPARPTGGLETSALCTTVAMVASAGSDLFSVGEKSQIAATLKEKGLDPCLTWLLGGRTNNWLAVVASGAYTAATYLQDGEGMDKALDGMVKYVNGSIEADGSYGEGKGYFDYPIGSLFPALLVMDPAKRVSIFSSSGLRYSATWMVYPYLFSSDSASRNTVLHSGDNSYSGSMDSKVGLILGYLLNNPIAIWLMERFEKAPDLRELLFMYATPTILHQPSSPAQSGLPLVKKFDNGDAYIRSSWDEDGIVLLMRSGNGSLVNYSHQRPEIGSISLGAYGEYLVVSPGSASYRSPLRYQWDLATKSANTITIDQQNQLFPERSVRTSWNTVGVPAYWQDGNPKAAIVLGESGELADVLVNNMAGAYHVPMEQMTRMVLFVKDPGYYVVVDWMSAKNGLHQYSWRIHLNNRDGQGKLKQLAKGSHWHFARSRAGLDIHVFSDRPVASETGNGYMHGTSRDYSPGGVNEGKLGSSIGLEVSSLGVSKEQVYYAVLYPVRQGGKAPAVKQTADGIIVGKDMLAFANGECVIQQNGKTEKHKIW